MSFPITHNQNDSDKILFNLEKCEIRKVWLKKVTHSDSIKYLQVRDANDDEAEAYKLEVHGNALNVFNKTNVRNFAMEVPITVLMYNNVVVTIECRLISGDLDSLLAEEHLEDNIAILIANLASEEMLSKTLYADLNGIYWEYDNASIENTRLTEDDTLTGVALNNLMFNDFNKTAETALTPKLKYAIRYTHPTKKHLTAITTPIFSSPIGKRQADIAIKDGSDVTLPIDIINKNFRVNMNFMIMTSKKLEKFVDYEELDGVFGIFDVVCRLGVESLPKLPKSTRETYPIKLSVKDCIVWLLGLQTRYSNESIQNLEVIRSSIKFLLTKCLTKDGNDDPINLCNEGFTNDSVFNVDSK